MSLETTERLGDLQEDEGSLNALPPTAPSKKGDGPGLLETAAAAFRTSGNTATSLYDRLSNPRPAAPAEPGYDPLVHVPAGYEPQASRFLDARNEKDIEWIRQQIDEERAAQSVIRQAGGWGVAATFAAGTVDPITLASMAIPVGGATRIGSAVRLAAVTAGSSVAQNQVNQALTPGGSDEQPSLLNIGVNSMVAGMLGAAFHVPPKVRQRMAEDLTEQFSQGKTETTVLGPQNNGVLSDNAQHQAAEHLDLMAELARHEAPVSAPAAAPAPAELLADTLARRPVELPPEAGDLFSPKAAAKDSVATVTERLPPADSGLPEVKPEGEPPTEAEPPAADQAEPKPFIANPSGESTVGAGTSGTGFVGLDAALQAESIAPGARMLSRTVGKVAPGLRALTSPSLMVRRLVQELANTGEVLAKHMQGIASAIPIERLLWKYEGVWQIGRDGRSEQFKAYRQRMAGAGKEAMSRREFDEATAQAMRRGDTHPIPEVEAAAKDTRAKIFEPLFQRAKKLGIMPEGSKLFAESYLMRQYDAQKIVSNQGDWMGRLQAHYEGLGIDTAEARDIAHKVTRNITMGERGTMDWKVYEDVVPKSGTTKARVLDVPDSVLEPYLVSDLDTLTHSYLRSLAPEVEMTERFGSRDLSDQLKDVADEYARLKELRLAQGDDAGAAALDARHQADVRDLAAIRDRLYGIYGQPKDPGSFFVRAGRLLRAGNLLRLLGSAALAHIPDIANVITRYGLKDTIAGTAKILTSSEALRMTQSEAHRFGAALDMAMNVASLLGDYGSHSQFAEQRIMNKLTRGFAIATLETPLITAVQMVASTLGQHSLLETAERVAGGGNLPKNDMIRLAQAGIDRDMLSRIHVQATTHGQEINGLKFGMSDLWTDTQAAEAFESAILKDAHGMTLRPSVGDTPLVISGELGKLVLQFKTFAFAASRSVINPMMQGLVRGDPRAFVGISTLVAAGAASYVAKQQAAGQPVEWDNPGRFALEILDKSNLMGWTADAIFPLLWQFGFKDLSRWSDRDPVETLLGPSAGTVASAFQRQFPAKLVTTPLKNAAGEADGTEPTFKRSDEHFLRRIAPGQNIWWFRRAVNNAEDSIGDFFNLEGKSNADRAAERVTAE